MRKYYIDNLRSFTVLLVVFYHILYLFHPAIPAGVIGPIAAAPWLDAVPYLLYPWFMLILFLVTILGAVLPTLLPTFPLSTIISKKLTVGLWFTLCLAVAYVIPVDGKPVISPVDSFKNGIIWPLILNAGVMLYFSGIIGSEDAGIKAALSGAFGGVFQGMPGVALLLVACLLTVIITGFFSNMATGVIFMSVTIPLASAFNLSPLVLGVCIMWASMPGFITPGGTGTSPYLHGLTTITKKNMYAFMLSFLVLFLVVILVFGFVMNFIF